MADRKNFLVQMAEHFKRPGQPTKEFMDEIKALTDQDKADFCDWFNAAGFPTNPASSVAKAA